MSEGRLRHDGRRRAAAARSQPIGVGMLGYAFMGKAHSNAYKTLAYMTWPPPLMPQLVAIAGRNEEAVAEAARRYGFDGLRHRLEGARRRRARAAVRQLRAEQPARRADDRRRRGGQARDLREAARARRRRVLRDLAARRGDRRQAHVRVQLPLRAGGAARAPDDRVGRARRDPALPRRLPAGVGHDRGRASGASTRRSPARARSATSARTSSTSPATSSARSTAVSALTATFQPGREVDDAVESVGRVRERRRRDDRGLALLPGPQEPLRLGDQRLEGLARVRPRAPQRAAALRGQRGLPHRARLRGRPPVLGALVAAGAHDRLGAHVRARAPPPADGDPRRRRRGAARRDARGRLPRGRGLRRDAALGRRAAARETVEYR